MDIFKKIAQLLKGSLTAIAGFTGILFSFITEIGFYTRNKTLTVCVAFLIATAGLVSHIFLPTIAFYSYVALIFIGGIVLRGYNSARSSSSKDTTEKKTNLQHD